MVQFLRNALVLLITSFFCVTISYADDFTAGKDYQNIDAVSKQSSNNKNIEVVEFFNYGCPWCFKIEPIVEEWSKTKPHNVTFTRVPVSFEQGWDTYSKAYYTAVALNVDNNLTPAIFAAIHQQNLNLTNENDMAKFFESKGVSKDNFESVFNFSPGIGMKMNQGTSLMQTYKVFEIPTFVINGKYKTNLVMAQGKPDRLIAIVNYLVNKESNSANKTK